MEAPLTESFRKCVADLEADVADDGANVGVFSEARRRSWVSFVFLGMIDLRILS